jgi:peptide-methionine (R)-S-oxide reductase
MKYRPSFLILTVLTLGIATAMISNSDGNVAAAAQSISTDHRPTATPKPPVKVKTVREITYTDGEFDGVKVVKTAAEWKKILTQDEFAVMRLDGTERPYSGEYTDNHSHGTYYCAACGLALFKSEAKFDSGTGWPSFYQAINKKNVKEKSDRSLDEVRIEVECARCGGHLGHVFDDGPKPTGLRYCMNSVALRFKAD